MTAKLAGKSAVVTGASKGIGAAIAKHLAAAGAKVVVNYSSSPSAAAKVVAEITGQGGTAIAVGADVSKPEEIQRLFAESTAAFGPLDILVNNAGIYHGAPVGEITPEHFHQQYDLNVLGLILASQEALKHFGPDGGCIVNLSSVVATLCPVGTAVYNSTKAAVDNLTRTFAKELGPKKIRVNAVNPGPVETEGTHAAGFVGAFDQFAAITPLGRVGQPDDIALGVVFLASDDSRWMTGETLYLTGGLR
jgi:3-oxoacyl-[acyl-carrier protein] reductase